MKSDFLSFKLNISTVEKEICSIVVTKLIANGVDGEFQVLRNHVPFLTKLVPGCVFFVDVVTNNIDGIVLSGGIIEVQPGQVFIFADTAVRSNEIDYEKSRRDEIDMMYKLRLIEEKNFDKKEYESVKVDLLLASAKLMLLKQLKK